jgi:hypothetical protein
MSRSSANKPLGCSELAVLALLGGVVLVGLAAQGLARTQFLVSTGFGATVLLLVRLWDMTLRQEQPRPPLTRRQWWAWNLAVLALLLTLIGFLIGWYLVGPGKQQQPAGLPAANDGDPPGDGPADAGAAESPPLDADACP